MSLNLAVVLPGMLTLVLLAVQGCLWWYAREAALTAAREGVERGRVTSGGGPGAAGERARQAATDLAGGLLTDVSVTTGGGGDRIFVTVSGHSLSVVPFVRGISISQTVSGPVERFTTPRG
jgi:hypothetical protein